ncbi:putative acyl-CoA oxidase [Tieghemostelium lacteum]|uniref:Acyl-coenzyme A oxidase n=1 Tax=Tieghemostelium lacteum TaxID=361077 RepID=A0A151ZKZ0_TIELA|nr:putative acyl-CoA oxidase [Tieghemostelium lacteum]|eukprot:KYQ94454.1 putative acyl-CoA oxidase [Tieghemostelium lacteum]
MSTEERLRNIISHLVPNNVNDYIEDNVTSSDDVTSFSRVSKWDKEELREFLENSPTYKPIKQKLLQLLKDPIFLPRYNMNVQEWRELTLQRALVIIKSGSISISEFNRDPMKYLLSMEMLNMSDPSLSVKLGVHFSLFGNAVLNLGTEKHHLKYIKDIDSWKLPGCFGMTELGHGSNVQGIETTATYDKSTQEFIINTPSDSAQKFWIGNAALHGQACSVFAQLYIDNVHHGVHVFIVPIRNPDGSVVENVRIMDNGHKLGLQGVDNGRIWFDNKRIPRDNLLNKFGDVQPDGTYVSSIQSKNKRFGSMVAPLVGGRVLIASSALNAAKLAMIVATRYAYSRKQFGSKGNENPIISYLTHQRRLFPMLAAVIAYTYPIAQLKKIYCEPNKSAQNVKDLHVWSSGLKAVVSWTKTYILQITRECCGGQGFSSFNQIAGFKSDLDVDMTYEGDNHVLLQQVARNILVELQKGRYTITSANHGSSIYDADFQIQCLKWRESNLVQSLSARIMSHLDQGRSLEQGWNSNLDIVTFLGKAFVDRVTMESFQASIKKASNSIKPVLELCRNLFFSWRVSEDLGYFLCNDGISHSTAQKIQDSINHLCSEMLPVGLDLVNSLDIPEQFIHAPIAKADYMSEFRYGLERKY